MAKKTEANDKRDVHGIRVGKPETHPEAPGHQRGMGEGNRPKHPPRDEGASRSTGIRAPAHDPIDPKMPKIPPA